MKLDYRNNKAFWPWSDVVRLVTRYGNLKPRSKVLELGCGYGANIMFFHDLQADYYGIDVDKDAVDYLQPDKTNQFVVCENVADSKWFGRKFDLILDRWSLPYCNDSQLTKVVNKIHKHLKKNGLFILIDWPSNRNFQLGMQVLHHERKSRTIIKPVSNYLDTVNMVYKKVK